MRTRLRHSPTAARAVIPAAGARAGARARRGGARRGAGRRRPAEGRALGGAAPLRAGRAPLPPRPKARRRRRPPRPRPAEQPLIPPPRPAHSPRPSSGRSPAGRAEPSGEMNTVLSRANSLFAFSLSVMAALTFGCFITTAFKERSVPVSIAISRVTL